MTVFGVTGATGHLGRLVVDALLARGVPAGDIVAIVRTPTKAADLAAMGVSVREGDYSRPETLPVSLKGVGVLLLISGSEVGRRVAQHTAVIEAAKDADVERIVYTSILGADTSKLILAPEHRATEAAIRESGLPFTFLRNGSYIENFTSQLDAYLAAGEIVGATGNAPIAGATRADLAEAASVVLTTEGHANSIYELGGTPFTMTDLADAITTIAGVPVAYRDMPVEAFAASLLDSGMDEQTATFIAELDRGTAQGGWMTNSEDLKRLLGRPVTPLTNAIRATQS